jgi:hypothetical protein
MSAAVCPGRPRGPIAVAVLVALSCSTPGADVPREAPLPETAAARVAGEVVDIATVVRIAAAQSVGLPEARERAVRDALYAAHARTLPRGNDTRRRAERRARAEVQLTRLMAEARQEGAPTDDELEKLVTERWWELDRPELRRAVHAVVVSSSPDDPGARALAERIEGAVRHADTAEQFVQLAKSVSAGSHEVRVEPLDPCAADGRVVDPARPPASGQTGRYAAAFAQALFRIEDIGRTSGVFQTEFGYHVALLTERIPEHRLSPDQRRAQLGDEVIARRAQRRYEALRTELRSRTPVELERAAVELTMTVRAIE